MGFKELFHKKNTNSDCCSVEIVADDDTDIAHLARRALVVAGHDVVVVTDGVRALAHAGAADLEQFRARAVVGVQSPSGYEEGRPVASSWA